MIDYQSIKKASERIESYILKTPVLYSDHFSEQTGKHIYFKAENLQRTGSFKIRGAANFALVKEVGSSNRIELVTASSGNHGLGVACMASLIKTACTVVVPETVSRSKIQGIRKFGSKIIKFGNSSDERKEKAIKLAKDQKALFVHSHDDELVICGQGTAGIEILQQLPEVDTIVVPVGGGGLISGISTVAKHLKPSIRIIGVEPEKGPSMRFSLACGKRSSLPEIPSTIADGLRGQTPGFLAFDICTKHVDEILTVTEESIMKAVYDLAGKNKLVTEPSGAVVAAALMSEGINIMGSRICALISGGNIDDDLFVRIITQRSTG